MALEGIAQCEKLLRKTTFSVCSLEEVTTKKAVGSLAFCGKRQIYAWAAGFSILLSAEGFRLFFALHTVFVIKAKQWVRLAVSRFGGRSGLGFPTFPLLVVLYLS